MHRGCPQAAPPRTEGTHSDHPPCLSPRSPPRPSPGSLHYSDEDVTKYNDLIPAESSSLTEKPSEVSDSQVTPGAAHGDRDLGQGGMEGAGSPP